MNAYKSDLAYIHDTGFGDFAENAAPWLLDTFSEYGIDGLVVDLGCGSGIWAAKLLDAGYRVLGIDISPAMIEIARSRVPEAQFKVGSFLDLPLPDCQAITCLGECLNYLFDENNSETELQRLFNRVYEALSPGGIFIFDLIEPGTISAKPRQKWTEGDDWAVLMEVEGNRRHSELKRRIVSFRKVGLHYQRDEEIHRLKLYRGMDIARYLRGNGFRVRVVRNYGALRFGHAHLGFLARKPARIP